MTYSPLHIFFNLTFHFDDLKINEQKKPSMDKRYKFATFKKLNNCLVFSLKRQLLHFCDIS